MGIKKKIRLFVILLLVPIWLDYGYGFGYVVPKFFIPYCSRLVLTLLFSGIVVSLVSYWTRKTVIIPVTFFVMGIFLIWWSTVGKGVAIYDFMTGAFFIMTGLVTAVFVVASTYKKP